MNGKTLCYALFSLGAFMLSAAAINHDPSDWAFFIYLVLGIVLAVGAQMSWEPRE